MLSRGPGWAQTGPSARQRTPHAPPHVAARPDTAPPHQGNRGKARSRRCPELASPAAREPRTEAPKEASKRASDVHPTGLPSVSSGFLALLPPCEKIGAAAQHRPGQEGASSIGPALARDGGATRQVSHAGGFRAAGEHGFFHTEEARRGSRRTRRRSCVPHACAAPCDLPTPGECDGEGRGGAAGGGIGHSPDCPAHPSP